ncbi:hypothetical protein BBJ28_00001152 [Nothophytophthora sp. Chile5]|nr:hypothetical protein BBJ28_00001152 [Nothophytophthora sp. Chile5]
MAAFCSIESAAAPPSVALDQDATAAPPSLPDASAQPKEMEESVFETMKLEPDSDKRGAAIGTVQRRKIEVEKLREMEKQLIAKLKAAKLAANLSSPSPSNEVRAQPKVKKAEEVCKKACWAERALRTIVYKQYRLLESPPVNPSVDNDAVFDSLMVGIDELYAGVDRFFEEVKMQELLRPGRRNLRPTKKLADQVFVEFLDRYDVPFDVQSTASAVWKCLGEQDLETQRRKHLLATVSTCSCHFK